MTVAELKILWNKYVGEEFCKFENIEERLSTRRDMHAMIILDKVLPGNNNMIAASGHDEVWLCIACEDLAEVITEEDILNLVRCGVMLDSDEGLKMFV